MKRLALIAALSAVALPAMAQPAPFPMPGSANSTQIGPYTYHYGNGWSGQSTQIGPYGYHNFTGTDGRAHSCQSTTLGQYTSTNCN